MHDKWIALFVGTCIIIGLDVAVLQLTSIGWLHIQYLIGTIGFVTFFSTLVMLNLVTGSSNLDRGELRKTITITTFVIYFLLIGLDLQGHSNTADNERTTFIMKHFTYLVELITSFYFGTKIIETVKKPSEDKTEA